MVTIDQFLALYVKENTKVGYRTSLTQYFDFLKVPPSDYFKDGRRYEEDVVNFKQHLKAMGRTSKSIECKMGCIRSYLLENDIELSRRFWKRMKITGHAVTQDRLFTKEELRRIFMHLDLLGRAFFALQLSTGLRLKDALAVKIPDLKLELNPPRFRYNNHKIERLCTAFLTNEAKELLREWLNNREEYMLTQMWKNAVFKGDTDVGFEEFCEENHLSDLLFPMTRNSIYARLWDALDKTGLNQRDPTTNRRVLHDHVYRKYYKSWAGTVLPSGIVECLIGHTGGLNTVNTTYNLYGKDCEEALAQDFLKIEPLLSLGIEVASAELTEVHEALKAKDEKILKMQSEIRDLKAFAKGLEKLIWEDFEKEMEYQHYLDQHPAH